jgi:hypothetical protein
MMARGGNPKLTWLEDQLIALSLFEPFVGDFSQDLATVKSFLENKFPAFSEGSIADFIKTASRARKNYMLMIFDERETIRHVADWSPEKIQEFA